MVEDDLILWVPPFFSIDTADRADAVLAAALAEVAPTPPDSSLTLVTKAERGPAGMLSYLLSTHRAASVLLPDVVLIHSFDLARLADAGIIVALSSQETASFGGIAPQFLETAQIQGAQYGLPFVANMEHLVYQTERVATPPATWADFLAQDERLLFAGGSADDYSISIAWTLYVLGGGKLDEQGHLTNPQMLESVFEFLGKGRKQGLIPDSALTLASSQAVWTFFINGDAEMAVVPANLYYNQKSEASSIGFAPIPAPNGEPRAVVTSWSFAIITQDPARRRRVLRFLEQLFMPNVQGEWSWSARQLPTQKAAFAYWDMSDPYSLFLQQMVDAGIATSNPRQLAEIIQTVQQLQRSVLAGEISSPHVLDGLPVRP